MPTSLKKILFLISTGLFITTCTPRQFRDLVKADTNTRLAYNVNVFPSGLKESVVYKTKIVFREKEFSSLTYLNSIDTGYKIVLLSNFGNTMLEAELTLEKFVVNNCIPELDRKIVHRMIEKDWRILLFGKTNDAPRLFSGKNPDQIAYVYSGNRNHTVYYYDKINPAIREIEYYEGSAKKISVSINSYRDELPENITVGHPGWNLRFEMVLLKKVKDEPAE